MSFAEGYLVFSSNENAKFSVLPLTGTETPGDEEVMTSSPNLKLNFYSGFDDYCLVMIQYVPDEEEFFLVKSKDATFYKYITPYEPLIISKLSNESSSKKKELFDAFCGDQSQNIDNVEEFFQKLTELQLELDEFKQIAKDEKTAHFSKADQDFGDLWSNRGLLFVNQEIRQAMAFSIPSFDNRIQDVDGFIGQQMKSLGDPIKKFVTTNATMKDSKHSSGVSSLLEELEQILGACSQHIKQHFDEMGFADNRELIAFDYKKNFVPLIEGKLIFFFSLFKKLRDMEYYEDRDYHVDKMLKKMHIGGESTEMSSEFLKKSLYTLGYYLINLYFQNYTNMFNRKEDDFLETKYTQIEGLVAKHLPDLEADLDLAAEIEKVFVKNIKLFKLFDPNLKMLREEYFKFVVEYVNKVFEINRAGLVELFENLWKDVDELVDVLNMLGSGQFTDKLHTYLFSLVTIENKVRRDLI